MPVTSGVNANPLPQAAISKLARFRSFSYLGNIE